MLDTETKRRIDTARDILVGKIPDPKSQVEQITIALVYKFMDDMDRESVEMGGKPSFFTGEYQKYGWSKIFSPQLGGFEMLALYADAITRMSQNPNIPQLFRDIFKNAFLPYRDPETLKLFLKTINEFHYDHSERLGDAFEYLLSVLGSQGEAGQFRTPRHIIDFMVEVINPQKNETILDPACGTAGFLVSSYRHILAENTSISSPKGEVIPEGDRRGFPGGEVSRAAGRRGNPGDLLNSEERKRLVTNFKGYDISPDMVRLSLVNLYLHGFVQPQIYEYDTLTSEERWNEYADVILANPPFMSPKGGIKPHKRFSVQSNRSEVLFVDYMAEHLFPAGRAAIVVPEGIIFQSGKAYKSLRKMLVDDNFLVGVISLPAGVFNPYSGVKTCILWLDRTLAKKTDKILFVKISADGFDLGAQRRSSKVNDLTDALININAYKHAVLRDAALPLGDILNFSMVEKVKIAMNGEYALSGERYNIRLVEKSNYEIIRIGDIFDTSSGGTPLKSVKEYWENGKIPWLKSGEVSQGIITNSEDYITEAGLKNSSAKLFPANSVLIAMYGATAGQVGLLKFESSTNQAVCAILPNDKAIPEFLYYIVRSQRNFLITQCVGGAQPNISQSIIKDLKVPLPPLAVQQELVSEIESYQKIIDGARQVVENYKPRVEIDSEWEVELFEELCLDMTNGVNFSIEQVGKGTKFVNIKDVFSEGVIDLEKLDRVELSSKEIERKKLFDSDILFVRSSVKYEGVGFPSLFKAFDSEPVVFCGFLIKATLNKEKVVPEFLLWLLRTDDFRKKVIALSNKANITNISQDSLKSLPIPLPSLPTQQAIVDRIEHEQSLVRANRELIEVYEGKIKEVVGRV